MPKTTALQRHIHREFRAAAAKKMKQPKTSLHEAIAQAQARAAAKRHPPKKH